MRDWFAPLLEQYGIERRGAYWTPHNMVSALLEEETFPGPIWEPACGSGNISTILKIWGYKVYSSDAEDYGYRGARIHNFFLPWGNFRPRYKSLITNPPYHKIWKWVKEAIHYKPKPEKVAMLLPAASLGDCATLLPGSGMSLTRVIVFRRPPKFIGPDGVADVNWGCAWFVFSRGEGLPGVITSADVDIEARQKKMTVGQRIASDKLFNAQVK